MKTEITVNPYFSIKQAFDVLLEDMPAYQRLRHLLPQTGVAISLEFSS